MFMQFSILSNYILTSSLWLSRSSDIPAMVSIPLHVYLLIKHTKQMNVYVNQSPCPTLQMLHGIQLRNIVYILTHHQIKSMTLLLKLFLFHILYACGNKITPFSSVCVNSQNFKIFNLSCTVLLTLGVKWSKSSKQQTNQPSDVVVVIPSNHLQQHVLARVFA